MELRFLHVSDLHLKARDGRDPVTVLGQDVVNTALLEALRAVAAEAPLDVVAVTGDVAYAAQPAEYDVARAFFERLRAATGLPKERFYVVPGNPHATGTC